MMKKLYRVEEGKMLCGVCGGIAEYFDIDPTIVRVLWALSVVMGGAGVLAYLVCAFIIPAKDSVSGDF